MPMPNTDVHTHKIIFIYIVRTNNTSAPNFMVLCSMGVTAGVCGAFVGTPAEMALIRMSSDGRLPLGMNFS